MTSKAWMDVVEELRGWSRLTLVRDGGFEAVVEVRAASGERCRVSVPAEAVPLVRLLAGLAPALERALAGAPGASPPRPMVARATTRPGVGIPLAMARASFETTGADITPRPSRNSVVLDVELAIASRWLSSRTRNLSLGGAFVESSVELVFDTRLNLRFLLPNEVEPVEVRGAVRWSGPQGFGVQFLGLRDRHVWAFGRFFEQLQATRAHDAARLG